MSEIVQTVSNLAGNSPSEIWSRTGQLLVILGAASFIGVNAGGISFGQVDGYSPLLLIFLGGFSGYYGKRVQANMNEDAQRHAIELAREVVGGIFPPSTSINTFVREILDEPKSRAELFAAEEFSGIRDKPRSQVVGLYHQRMAEAAVPRGAAIFDHELGKFVSTGKSHNDQTVINK